MMRLGDIAVVRQGRYVSPADMVNDMELGAVPVWGGNGIIGSTNRAMFDNGVPLVTCRGSNCGLVLWGAGPLWVSNNAMAVVPSDPSDARYAFYSLLSCQFDDVITGSAQPQITVGHLQNKRVPWAQKSERDKIAGVLIALDDKIDLNRQMNQTLEGIARALFKSWFIDFDPVRAKVEGRASGLSPEVDHLFTNSLDDSGLPTGWKAERLGHILELLYGKALSAQVRRSGRVPVYGSGGRTGWHDEVLVDGPGIIVGRKGTVGSLYWEDEAFFPIDTVFYVRSDWPLTYCFYRLQTLGLETMNTDAAVPGLNRENAYRLTFASPPFALALEFDRIVSVIRERIRLNTQQSETLAALRDLLLPKLMSGAIRVRDAEKMLEQVA